MKRVEAHYPLYETRTTRIIGQILAVALLAITLAQLFSFDDFYVILAQFWAISRDSGASLAAVIVAAEVFSLPFLLGMKLSTGMRLFSALLLLGVAAYWGAAAAQGAFNLQGVDIGVMGGIMVVTGGVGALLFAVLFLAAVTAYFGHVYIDSHQLHQHLRKHLK